MAGGSSKTQMKLWMIDDPHITLDELMAKLKKKYNPPPSRYTVAAIRQEFRHSLRLLKEEGLLVKSFKID